MKKGLATIWGLVSPKMKSARVTDYEHCISWTFDADLGLLTPDADRASDPLLLSPLLPLLQLLVRSIPSRSAFLMAKPSKRIIHGFQRLCFHDIHPNPLPQTPISSGHSRFFNSRHLSSNLSSNHPSRSGIWRGAYSREVLSKPASQNCIFSRFLSPKFNSCSPQLNSFNRNCSYGNLAAGFSNSTHMSSGIPIKLPSFSSGIKGIARINENGFRYRFSSAQNYSSIKFNGNFGKVVVEKPLSAVSSAFSRYREAVGLQVEAFWKRNYLALVGAGAVVVCIALWRIMFGVASMFVGLSEGMAKYGFLALATAIVAFTVSTSFIILLPKVLKLGTILCGEIVCIKKIINAMLIYGDFVLFLNNWMKVIIFRVL